jgi:hypothetical protein
MIRSGTKDRRRVAATLLRCGSQEPGPRKADEPFIPIYLKPIYLKPWVWAAIPGWTAFTV